MQTKFLVSSYVSMVFFLASPFETDFERRMRVFFLIVKIAFLITLQVNGTVEACDLRILFSNTFEATLEQPRPLGSPQREVHCRPRLSLHHFF